MAARRGHRPRTGWNRCGAAPCHQGPLRCPQGPGRATGGAGVRSGCEQGTRPGPRYDQPRPQVRPVLGPGPLAYRTHRTARPVTQLVTAGGQPGTTSTRAGVESRSPPPARATSPEARPGPSLVPVNTLRGRQGPRDTPHPGGPAACSELRYAPHMPKIVLVGPRGESMQLASNRESTIIAWFDEWMPRFIHPEFPVQIWVTGPVWGDLDNLAEPDWSCDTRFLGTPLYINSMDCDMPGERVYGLLMQHLEYIRRLEREDDERRGKNVD